ncbi:hypothetical protein GCM10009818_11500 [Nakamurella flavida]
MSTMSKKTVPDMMTSRPSEPLGVVRADGGVSDITPAFHPERPTGAPFPHDLATLSDPLHHNACPDVRPSTAIPGAPAPPPGGSGRTQKGTGRSVLRPVP